MARMHSGLLPETLVVQAVNYVAGERDAAVIPRLLENSAALFRLACCG